MDKKTRKQKDPWFVAATITKNTIFAVSLPCRFFFQKWPKLGLGDKLTRYFTYFKSDFSEMWYVHSEFDAAAEFLANKMIKGPSWALKLIDKVEDWSRKFISEAKKFKELPFSKMKNEDMIKAWNKVLKWEELSHGVGTSVSWHADADKERITKAITKMIEQQIQKRKLDLSLTATFSLLSTPLEESFVVKEEKEFLKIAMEINKPILEKNHSKTFSTINKHFQKWRWLPYGHKGPAYDLEHFLDRWQALFKGGHSPAMFYKEIINKKRKTRLEQNKLFKKLKFNSYQLKLIKLAQRLVFIKEFRKGALYHGMYCYEPFFHEIAKRLGLTIKHIQAMNAWEIPKALMRGKFNRQELEARLKEAVAYVDKNKYVVWTGKKAREFFNKILKEEIGTEEIKELKGTCASPGYARGLVKIVEVSEDMAKMEKGDILISETTYPSLVPAMKKAAAIVTNAGGLTCHAAIVSRELKIPCIVGTKIVTKVLKDGDLVEVDAEKGVVKIINKAK